MAKYRLQIILDKRKTAKEEAEKALAEAQKAVLEEKKKEEECIAGVQKAKQRKEDEKVEQNRKIMAGEWDVEKIKNGKLFLKTLDLEIKKAEERLEQQRQRIKDAEAVVEQKRLELMEATKEYQAIEKHK